MIRALVVLSAVLVGSLLVEIGSGDDPASPDGSNREEILGNSTVFAFKEVKGPTDDVDKKQDVKEDNEIPENEHDRETSLLIRNYLKYLVGVKDKSKVHVKYALDTIRLLVAYSWLFSLNPQTDLVDGTIPLPIDHSMPLDNIKDDIAAELRDRNSWIPVTETILLYTNGIFQSIKQDLQSNHDAYESMATSEMLFSEISDLNVRARFIEDNERYNLLMDENRLLLEIHVAAIKMALQSYLRLFRKINEGQQKVWLLSRQGPLRQQFDVPAMTADKLDRMIFEAELETVDSRHPAGDQQQELDRKRQNLIVIQYLKSVEDIAKMHLTESEDTSALFIVKLLFLQGWIHSFSPDLLQVGQVYPVGMYMTVNDIRKNIASELKNTVTRADATDSIVRFANSLHKQIRVRLLIQARNVCSVIDGNIKAIARLTNGPQKDTQINLKNYNLNKLTNFKSMLQLHEISTSLCLQSYVLDFLSPLTLTSTKGGTLTMDLPPLVKDSYKDLIKSNN